MKKRRAHVWIAGRVQGVFFRAYMQDAAKRTRVAGWVRNLPDGRVEAVFEGDSDKVDEMISWCHKGSPFSRVDRVEVVQEDYSGEFDGLAITH